MQKEFINIAAHELRTPIQPILSLSEIIRPKVDLEQQELLDIIIRNSKRLQHLTEDILGVTRIETQNLKLNKQRVNLTRLILDTLADFEDRLRKEKSKDRIKLSLVTRTEQHDNIFIEADKNRIIQVISNLLSNAMKFTKEGGITVTVETQEGEKQNTGIENSRVVVSVKDTGTGIDSEIMPRLFSKFVTKSGTGTGLGLFISKSIIEAHGGIIWAQNNENNGMKGAIFYFTLPKTVDVPKMFDSK